MVLVWNSSVFRDIIRVICDLCWWRALSLKVIYYTYNVKRNEERLQVQISNHSCHWQGDGCDSLESLQLSWSSKS